MIAHVPTDEVPVPRAVAALAAGRPLLPVWRNEAGGLTFRLGADLFVKWAPAGSGLDLDAERRRLRWAVAWTAVPRVLDAGTDDDGDWLVTAALAGTSAVAPRWRADPAPAVTAIGTGLRALHDRLPVDACPFTWSAEERVERARGRVAAPPPVDRLVVCHGDACAPNTLVDDAGRWAAHVDLGTLGVADRWADLAVATWSLDWNYGPGWEKTLLDAYGVPPDAERTAYYRLLWDLDA